jgi:hypothetical protein
MTWRAYSSPRRTNEALNMRRRVQPGTGRIGWIRRPIGPPERMGARVEVGKGELSFGAAPLERAPMCGAVHGLRVRDARQR